MLKLRFLTQHPYFKKTVLNVLNAPTSWGFKAVECEPPDIIVGINTKRQFSRIINGRRIYFSATILNKPPIILFDPINFIYGVSQSKLNADEYRSYIINHEFGHALGQKHKQCKKSEQCSVMYQMTKGVPNGSLPTSIVTKKDKKTIRL
jgi:hypothetical protein